MNGAEFENTGVVPAIEEADGVANGIGAFGFNVVSEDPWSGAAGFCGAAVIAFNGDHNAYRMRRLTKAVCSRRLSRWQLDIFRQAKLD